MLVSLSTWVISRTSSACSMDSRRLRTKSQRRIAPKKRYTIRPAQDHHTIRLGHHPKNLHMAEGTTS
jgi:hypothetical protein